MSEMTHKTMPTIDTPVLGARKTASIPFTRAPQRANAMEAMSNAPSSIVGLAAVSALFCSVACQSQRSRERADEAPIVTATTSVKPKANAVAALDVSLVYPIIESVGAKKRIHWEKTQPSDAHSPPDAWKIEFEKSGGFAGICWKNKAGNEGEAPGDDLSKARYRRLSFWAKGAAGGEVAEFRAGGVGNVKTRHRDSFDVTAGKIRLAPTWSEYAIYVSDSDLSSVMTPFCVLFHREDNPEHTVVYLDDIQYGG